MELQGLEVVHTMFVGALLCVAGVAGGSVARGSAASALRSWQRYLQTVAPSAGIAGIPSRQAFCANVSYHATCACHSSTVVQAQSCQQCNAVAFASLQWRSLTATNRHTKPSWTIGVRLDNQHQKHLQLQTNNRTSQANRFSPSQNTLSCDSLRACAAPACQPHLPTNSASSTQRAPLPHRTCVGDTSSPLASAPIFTISPTGLTSPSHCGWKRAPV